ncbi:MAG: response regulator [Planctomycetes bacterium]|nr:response regulator [Planctomycetota bacterium]
MATPRDTNALKRAHRALLELARLRSFHGDNLAGDVRTLTEIAAHAVDVERASVWLLDANKTKIVSLDLFERGPARHSTGLELLVADHPAYFRALEEQRLLAAHDAVKDAETREYRDEYLLPLGITSMLDAAVRERGVFAGVICFEHIGPKRRWTTEEEIFACAMADLVSLALESSRRLVTEAALAATERREREIFENTRDAIFLIGVRELGDYVVEALNPAAEAVCKHKSAQLRGASLAATMPAQVAAVVLESVDECARSGVPLTREIATQHPLDRWFDATFVPIRRDDGSVYRVACIARDVTDRVHAEREREALQLQVHRSQKLDALATLAAGVAHDFNNFLMGIIGNANLMLESGQLDGESLERLQQIIDVANRARDLVRQTMTFSRKEHLRRTPLAVAEVVADAVKMLASTLPRGIRVTVDVGVRDAKVLGDATMLHQVLANLLRNAVQAMGDSGELRVGLDVVSVDAEMTKKLAPLRVGRHVRIEVTDTGPGMDAATQARLFEPFFTTKPQGQGMGLGLAVVYGIVREHDGVVIVTSRVGEGTTFRVYVPLLEDATSEVVPATGAPSANPTSSATSVRRVLFVDDQSYVANLGAAMLKRLGCEPVISTDAPQALATFSAAPDAFALVITDYAMPQMNGVELATAIRGIRANVPIVLMSGFDAAFDGERVAKVGIHAILQKPFTLALLQQVLDRALRANESATDGAA